MKRMSFLLILACLTGMVGCNQSTDISPSSQTTATDDHNHGEVSRDHSVKGHSHGAGPHDGTIVDWGGGKYHVELTVDHVQQQATAYILGSDEKTTAPIDAPSIELSISDPEMQVILNAAAEEGDPEGKASRFIGTHEKLGVVQEYAGTMTGVIDGTPYSGDFKQEPHGDHDR